MRTKVISADTIDAAVDKILVELEADSTGTGSGSSSRENAIYFDGWNGLGASAVLQGVAERLAISNELTKRLAFDKVINIDCSKWESTRALQRKIAEQLNLPNWVMGVFDKQDEEDDFDGLDKRSRGVMTQVVRETYQTVKNSRFIVILQNGSDEEMDMLSFGLSLYTPYANSKLLWTFRGRFRLDPKFTDKVAKSTTTHVLLSAACSDNERDPHELWSYLVHHEAAQLSCNNNHKHGDGIIIEPAISAQCSLYMLKQCSIASHIIDYDWDIHTSNYWVCNGIIVPAVEQGEIDKPWKVGDALQQEISLNTDGAKQSTLQPHLARSTEQTPYWFSMAPSRFVLSSSGVTSTNMFLHSDRLGVLKLSGCTFSFSSPPFLCCHSLKFLWLDHCQDLPLSTTNKDSSDNHHSTDAADKEVEESWEFFQSLWVLDLRYTDWDRILSAQVMDLMTQLRELNVMGAKSWDMTHIRGRLRNIRKLRVTKSTCNFHDDDNLFSEMETMELLEFSGNHISTPAGGMASISGPAKVSRLKTVIINGCDGLKTISLRACKELRKLLLKGLLGSLEVLDLSGTSVKNLDLTQVRSPVLKRLILLGCEKLFTIKTISKNGPFTDVLRIDTTSTSASAQDAHPVVVHGSDRSLQQQKEEKFNQWQISLADARLFRSLDDIIYRLHYPSVHIDICPGAGGSSIDKLAMQVSTGTGSSSMVDSKYRDVLKEVVVVPLIYCCREMAMWDCPEIPLHRYVSAMGTKCIIKVMTQGQGNKLGTSHILWFMATSLHVYDDSSITSIPTYSEAHQWTDVKWCRVERCPKVHTLFPTSRIGGRKSFGELRTFWASKLLNARYIWDHALHDSFHIDLKFLHLDYCPRLIHVLPLCTEWIKYTDNLETLEIVCCGDLREVFPCAPAEQVKFFGLRRIHLHELPMLHHICTSNIYAPNLETVKIRGCWSLRRLPATKQQPPCMVDCEKEWWDRLEWDGLEAYHHPSLYRPTHSRHYKDARLPRGTLLR